MIKPLMLIGKKIHTQNTVIEPGFINKIAQAINYPNPFSFKEPILKTRSVNQIPLALLGTLIYLPTIYKTLGLNIKYVLLSRENNICHQPLIPNDSVYLVTFLKDAYEQQASSTPIGFCILHTFGFKAQNLSFFNEKILAIRGGFERRK